MRYIEPHAHMVSRTTDDYQSIAQAGCEALCEPAFWAGYDRGSVEGFKDYFRQLTQYEPARAAKFGIPHFTWLCINYCNWSLILLCAINSCWIFHVIKFDQIYCRSSTTIGSR